MPPAEPRPPVILIVGATGAVGRELVAILAGRRFPCAELRLAASRRAAEPLDYVGRALPVVPLDPAALAGTDLVFLCAGSDVSRRWAPEAVRGGATVIDLSSAFRTDPAVPLVVPEINGEQLHGGSARLVANPNCTTTIALMAAAPLHRAAGIERMVASTYQAISGAGAAMMRRLEAEAEAFPDRSEPGAPDDRPLLFNVFSHDSPVGSDGYNEEETKLERETRRILADETIAVAATCVRVPVLRTHCAAINLTLRRPLDEADARALLAASPGVRMVDDRKGNRFPEPALATGGDDVLVGRLRADRSQAPGRGLELFVAGDQLRKGAALNAVQIAERLIGIAKSTRAPHEQSGSGSHLPVAGCQ